MSVDRSDYVVLGISLDFDSVSDWFEDFEDELSGAPNRRFDMQADFMSGEFCIAGKTLAAAGDYDGFGLEIIKPEDIDKTELAQALSSAFDREITPEELQLFVFSTFS